MTYGGEDPPVSGSEVAEGLSVELHGGRLCRGLAWRCGVVGLLLCAAAKSFDLGGG